MSEITPPPAEQPIDPWLVERLLADSATAGDSDEPGLASLFAALRAPATPDELAGRDHYLEAFASAQTLRINPHPSRRNSMLSTLLAAKSVVAGVALVTVAAGTAAAAYTGSLPSGLQDVAHHNVGAPAAHASHSPKPTPTGAKPTPTATKVKPSAAPHALGHSKHLKGAALYGLCTAYTKGGLKDVDLKKIDLKKIDPKNVKLKNAKSAEQKLSKAAGGPTHIAEFCAVILKKHPEATPHPRPTGTPVPRPTGKPTTHPTGIPTTRPTEAP